MGLGAHALGVTFRVFDAVDLTDHFGGSYVVAEFVERFEHAACWRHDVVPRIVASPRAVERASGASAIEFSSSCYHVLNISLTA